MNEARTEKQKDAFEEMPTIDQMRLAAECWRDNGNRGACSPSAESLIRQANDCDRWADEMEQLRAVFEEACNEVRMSHGTPCYCKYCREPDKNP